MEDIGLDLDEEEEDESDEEAALKDEDDSDDLSDVEANIKAKS